MQPPRSCSVRILLLPVLHLFLNLSVMKFTTAFTGLAAVLSVNAATLGRRQSSECAGASKTMAAYDRPFVYPLFEACRDQLGSSAERRENPWVEKNCVAAAVSASVSAFTVRYSVQVLITPHSFQFSTTA